MPIIQRRTIIPYNPKLKELARMLRNNSTKSEILIWQQMKGYDFHRQKPLDNFIADFFCHELMLAIELDGFTHILDEEVNHDIENVLRKIEGYIDEDEKTHPRPLSRGGFSKFGNRHGSRKTGL